MNLHEALRQGRDWLEKAEIDPREARLLLAFVLHIRKEELWKKTEISAEEWAKYSNCPVIVMKIEKQTVLKIEGEKNESDTL